MFSAWFRRLGMEKIAAIIKKDLFSEHSFYFFIPSTDLMSEMLTTFSVMLSKMDESFRCSVLLKVTKCDFPSSLLIFYDFNLL